MGKWETCFWFSTFPSAFVAGAVEMWESRRLLARFPRGSWKEWEACFWLSTLSTAPAFPQLSSPSGFAPWHQSVRLPLVGLAFRLLILLGVLHPIARNVQFDDHAMMHQAVDRGRRHHCVFEDRFPFRERQIAGHQYAAAFVTFRELSVRRRNQPVREGMSDELFLAGIDWVNY